MGRRNIASKLMAISRGQTMAEYALILATIALVASALVQNAGAIVKTLVVQVGTLL